MRTYAWVKPFKNKYRKTVAKAFESVIKQSGKRPKHLRTVKRSEFYNQDHVTKINVTKI